MASSSSSLRPRYHVFISFRGEDTRNNFIGFLCAALRRKGVNAFVDDKLPRGEEISPSLLRAIEDSRFSVVIFSENFASSSWCLDELVKILDCKRRLNQVVLPIFYNVDPSSVRKQTGSYGQAFAEHEQLLKYKMEKVHIWRDALVEVASICGWDSRHSRSESVLIEEIVTYILNKLMQTSSSENEDLVGIDSRIKEVNSLLHLGSDDVLFLGICGMGGIGKTTLADAVYSQIYGRFEGYCFLENVKECSKKYGLVHLQDQLLSRVLMEGKLGIDTLSMGIKFIKDRLCSMRVLIVLDDVDNLGQLDALSGNKEWFGSGSRIIVTTRDEQLLIAHEVGKIYRARELNDDEAVKLFHQKAFRKRCPPEEYVKLTKVAVNYAKGLPLALKVLGSFFCGRSIGEWESALKKLKGSPNKEIQEILKVSFDGLDDLEKDLFLDIACFFNGDDKDYITKILDSCDLFPGIGLSVLAQKSLLKVFDNKVLMHDLLRDMGREIVRQESPKDAGKRSRLCSQEDVCCVLMNNSGTELVEGITFDLSEIKEMRFSAEAFASMKKLRFLKIYKVPHPGGYEYLSIKELSSSIDAYVRMNKFNEFSQHSIVHVTGGCEFLSDELRCLYWHGFPWRSLPSNFQMKNVVELNMCYSHIKHLWRGAQVLLNLTFMKLSYSLNLTKTPDFTGTPNLERLILEGCTSLIEVHPSIRNLNKLIYLNLKDCINLRILPGNIAWRSLNVLVLSGCSKLTKFPDIEGDMEQLEELYMSGCSIRELPVSIKHLKRLVSLDLRNCQGLQRIPASICELKSLRILILSGCSKLESFPEISETMESLRGLLLDGTNIKKLPSSIDRLTGLTLFSLRDCENLESLPSGISKLKFLESLTLSGSSKVPKLLKDLGSAALDDQETASDDGLPLPVVRSKILRLLWSTPSSSWSSLFSFWLFPSESSNSMNLLMPSFSGLYSLKGLDLSNCRLSDGAIPDDIGCLSSLEYLDLSRNNFHYITENVSQLSQLKDLKLNYCKRLRALPELPSNVCSIDAHGCRSLETLSSKSSVYTSGSRDFIFTNCLKLAENICSDYLGAQFQCHIQKLSDTINTARILYPGSGIPKWFIHRSMGSSVSLQLPPNWYNSKFKGLAICAVFAFKDEIPNSPGILICRFRPRESFRVDGYACTPNFESMYRSRVLKSDHMWLLYEAKRYLFSTLEPSQMSYIEASFENYGLPGEMKGCGISLVYEGEEGNISPVVQCDSRVFQTFDISEEDDSMPGRFGSWNEPNKERTVMKFATKWPLLLSITFLFPILLGIFYKVHTKV